MSFQDLKNIFNFRPVIQTPDNSLDEVQKVIKPLRRVGKHQASKKGHKHHHNLSFGQKNQAFKDKYGF